MADPYDFIAQQEGFRPKAYWDNKQWSIGYGTKASGPDETIDQNEARRRLQFDADKAGSYVDKRFPGLDPNKRAALTSFTYNLGPGWMDQGRLSSAVQAGDWNTAANVMREYHNANGQPNAGLMARRQRESEMFLGAAPSTQSPTAFTPTGRSMPYDDQTGRWIPEDEIKANRAFGSQMWQLGENAPGSKYSGIVGALRGLGLTTGDALANRDTRSNQDMQRRALENAAGAPDNVTLARHLMGVPPLQAQGLGILANSLDPAKKQALEAGAFELGHKKVLAPTQEEMARVQLEAAKRKDWFDEFAKSLIGVPSTPAAGAPSAPASPAAPSPQSPSAPIVPAGGAGLPGVPGISVAPPAAAAPAPTTIKEALPTSQEGLRAFLMKRPQHEREAFIVAMKTKPEEALKMLHDWTDPEKKGREAGQVKLAQENAEILANKPKNRVIASSVLEGLDRMDALAKSIHNNKALGFATGGWSPPQSTMAAIAMPWRNTRPGSKTSDVEGDIHTLVSQVGFNTLQAMREASKTGGALGNVSEKELAALQNALTTIGNTSISKEKYRENLRLIQVYAKRVRQRTLGAWKDQYGEDFAEPGGDAPPSYANPAPTAGAGAAKADPLGIRQ